ncbi:MAG: DNA repair exonuclease [Thermofilaceae archaeon]|nr:DNA repair exonuclease [Thermofilaceae archaeon]MCX8179895.1 DNA repair exonuclease [Thermofilaceae archaeon]MDW8004420.1 DNA repair exonuclease [Thermofilaceae archaeon]
MATVKLIHTADNHLDPKLSYLGSKMMERRKDFMDAFVSVVNTALQRKPHLFLVSGDLFDSVNPRNPARTQVIRAFRRLHSEGIACFMIAGNHDMPKSVEEGMSPLQEIEASGYARFFSSPEEFEVEHLRVEGLDVAVAGVSYSPGVPVDENPLRYMNLRFPREGDVPIAMLHYNFSGVKTPASWKAPTLVKDDVPKGYKYVALGHVHSRVVIELEDGLAAYPGSTERRSFAEEGDPSKGFLWVEIPQEGKPRVEYIETRARPMKTVNVEVSPSEDPIEGILSSIPPPDVGLLLRLVVKGRIPLAKLSSYSRAALLKKLEGLFFYVVIDDSELRCEVETPADQPIEAKSPIEAFKEEFSLMLSKTVSEEERLVLLHALKLGLQKLEESGGW